MFGLAHRAQGPQTLMFMLETSYFYNLSELATSIGLCGRYGLENIKQTLTNSTRHNELYLCRHVNEEKELHFDSFLFLLANQMCVV